MSLKQQLEEVNKQLKVKETKQRIAKHKLDEVKRNIRYGEKELEKLQVDPEGVYKVHMRALKLPSSVQEFEELKSGNKKKVIPNRQQFQASEPGVSASDQKNAVAAQKVGISNPSTAMSQKQVNHS